jgi:hypothetical protein
MEGPADEGGGPGVVEGLAQHKPPADEEYQSRYQLGNSSARHLSDAEYNLMLVVLEPNGTYRRHGSVKNDASWEEGWPLQPGTDCRLQAIYSSHQFRSYPALPVWAGNLWSGWVGFSVLP